MKNTMKTMLLTSALIAIGAAPVLAAETRTTTELVGYNETITVIVPKKDDFFARMDRNGDGVASFREFANKAQLDNEYEIFLEIDTDRSKSIDLAEYRMYDSKTKGEPVSETVGDTRYEVRGNDPAKLALQETTTTTVFVPAKRYNFTRDPR